MTLNYPKSRLKLRRKNRRTPSLSHQKYLTLLLISESSAVGSALRSGRRGRAFESPLSDTNETAPVLLRAGAVSYYCCQITYKKPKILASVLYLCVRFKASYLCVERKNKQELWSLLSRKYRNCSRHFSPLGAVLPHWLKLC